MSRFYFARIDPKRIDTENTRFKISTEQCIEDLSKSIETVGLLSPPLLWEYKSSYIVISGFRRITAFHRSSSGEIPCLIFSADDIDPLHCIRIAIADNVQNRSLNLIEQSRAIEKLSEYIDDDVLLAKESTSLGMTLNPPFINKLRRLGKLHERLQYAVINETISLTISLQLGEMQQTEFLRLLEIFELLRPTVSHQKEIVTLLREIAAQNNTGIIEILKSQITTETLQDEESDRNQRIQNLVHRLKEMRYPALSLAENNFKKLLKYLDLPAAMRLSPPKYFEGPNFSISMHFKNHSELRSHMHLLDKLLEDENFDRILRKDLAD